MKDLFLRKAVQRYGWEFFPEDVQESLRNDLINMGIIDITQGSNIKINATITPQELADIIRSDENICKILQKKYGDKISINQMVKFMDEAPIMRELMIAMTGNKINRIMGYLSAKHQEDPEKLSDPEISLISLLLNKFGGSLGCPTPEFIEEKIKQEIQQLIILNQLDKEGKDEKKD